MKHNISLVRHTILIIAVAISSSSCLNNKQVYTKDLADDEKEQNFDYHNINNNSKVSDVNFLLEAAKFNLAEIKTGNLAQQNGSINCVKELGKMMYVEHTKSLAELYKLAKINNVSLPTSQTEIEQERYKILSGKLGIDFGKEYCATTVNGHTDAINLFKKAANQSTDPDIRAWARVTLPSLRTHLDHSLVCQRKCSKM